MTRKREQHFDIHHRLPRSRGGTSKPCNLSMVDRNMHRKYHALFRNMTPEEMARMLNSMWIDPDVRFVVRRRKQ